MTENEIHTASELTGMTFQLWERLARWGLIGEGLAKHDGRGSWVSWWGLGLERGGWRVGHRRPERSAVPGNEGVSTSCPRAWFFPQGSEGRESEMDHIGRQGSQHAAVFYKNDTVSILKAARKWNKSRILLPQNNTHDYD